MLNVMEFLCGAQTTLVVGDLRTSNMTDEGLGGGAAWVKSSCHGHVLNTIAALIVMYLSLLLLMCLRCSGREGLDSTDGRRVKDHPSWIRTARPLLSMALLMSLCGELAEATLALSLNRAKVMRNVAAPLVAATCAVGTWLPAELLDVELNHGGNRHRLLRLLPVACGILMSTARALSVAQILLWNEAKPTDVRPVLGTTTAAFFLMIAIIDVLALQSHRKGYGKDGSKEELDTAYSSYRHEAASLYSKATFSWLTPLLRLGNTSPLELEDLGRIPHSERTSVHFDKFRSIYNSMKNEESFVPLWRCFCRCSWRILALSGLFKLSGDMVGLVGPMGISVIVSYVQRLEQATPVPHDEVKAVYFVSISEFFSNGYIMGVLVFLSALAQGTFSQSSTHLINVEGIRIKAALQAMIYDKSLKLPLWSFSQEDLDETHRLRRSSSSAAKSLKTQDEASRKESLETGADCRQDTSTSHTDFGTITNLMSEDTYNVMSFIWICHYVWAIPVKIAVLMFLLHYQLGISALIGAILCVAIMTPLQFVIGKKMSINSKSISEANDERLRRLNEVLHGIKVIKLSGWEEQYEHKVQLARNRELRLLNLDSFHWAIMTFLTHASSAIVTLVTFGIYMVLEESPLPTANVFASLALFNQLTVPLFIFPITVPIIISAIVSTKRLEAFFSKPETNNVLEFVADDDGSPSSSARARDTNKTNGTPYQPEETTKYGIQLSSFGEARLSRYDRNLNITRKLVEVSMESEPQTPHSAIPISRGSVVSICDGNFSWSTGHVLSFNDVEVPQGGLTLVVGAIGSGKTSLLLALLGEMSSSDGRYPVRWSQDSSVAYCSQKPWLLNANVRENILFGQLMRRRRYNEVVAACALQPDLDILPTHDLTEIGERGINLSGGQKHRVAIARALYSSATAVLMDDPLSALDYQVGQHLVKEGFQKLLRQRGRTVILATHCLSLLNQADHIIVMEHGRASIQGSLLKIQTERADLAQAWQQALTGTQDEPGATSATSDTSIADTVRDFRGERTARERWQLVRLVSRIGLQQRSEEEESSSQRHFRRFSRRQSRSLYRTNHYTHSFPLPVDECPGPPSEVNPAIGSVMSWARPIRRTRSTITSAPDRWRRKVTRVASLQPHDTARYPAQAWHHGNRTTIEAEYTPAGLAPDSRCLFEYKFKSSGPIPLANDESPNDETVIHPLRDSSTTEGCAYAVNRSYIPEEDEESITESVEQVDRQSMVEVGRRHGRVPRHVYFTYAKACTIPVFLAYFLSTLSWQGLRVYTDFWLSDWTAFNGTRSANSENHSYFQNEMLKYLSIYSILSVATMLLSLTSNLIGQLAGARARHWLHKHLLSNLLRSPVKFFDTTPIGRVIDRLSTDIAVIDKKLATSIQRLMQFLSLCLSAILVNAILSPWFLLPALPMCLAYYIIQHFYRVSTRELHRMDSITRAPVSSFFSETLGGLATIRAFGQKSRFMELMLEKMDTNNNTFLILSAANRWLGVALDYMGGAIVLISVIGSLLAAKIYPGLVSPSLVGLAINYTLLVPIYLNWVVKFLADVEMYMGSVERVQQYAEMRSEDYNTQGLQVSAEWPESGDIRFEGVSLRYDENRDPVIRNLTLHIPAGQKVGLCGRTGSGKSSLVMSLFRMLDVSHGSIFMDGVDISKLPLQLLRSRLSVIPQDIVMFSGSIRENLDPEGLYTDEKIWKSLEVAQLKGMVEALSGGLHAMVKEGGENLSVGTRQLFCLARAILQNAAILVMDEATSSVDPATEHAFLSVALNAFARRTVIIIAHRLSTLLDCDRVLVLENGKVIEDGSPSQLLKFGNGVVTNC